MVEEDVELRTELDPKVPPLMMATLRPEGLRIGPMIYESIVEVVPLLEGEEPDAALKRKGWARRFGWERDGAGPWTLVAKVG